jgi:hypothetical protein
MERMFDEIDRSRRYLLGAAAVSFAADQLGLVRPASAQSNGPRLPTANEAPPQTDEVYQLARVV